jgi:nucleotide-binding universal stress UspA family protein
MTSMFNHILVPTDFGGPAEHARDIAIAIAGKFGAKITLFHAYYLPPMPLGNPFNWPISEVSAFANEEMAKELATAKREYDGIDSIVRSGSPAESILSVARELSADLIAMGTNGRRGASHLLLGSVAASVVRLATVPVLTAPELPAAK